MKPLSYFIALGLFCHLFGLTSLVSAQTETNVIYTISSNEITYTVDVVNPIDGSNSTLFSTPTNLRGILPQVLPTSELNALNAYTDSTAYQEEPLSEATLTTTVDSISVSPDNQQVVVKVIYRKCYDRQHNFCFGTTQLLLLNRINGNQKLLLNLGSTDDQFFPSPYPEPDIQINRIDWLLNQQAIIVGVSDGNRRTIPRSAILLVPTDGRPPSKMGEGITWTIVPDSREIVVLAQNQDQESGLPNTLKFIDFDLSSGQVSQSTYDLGTWYIRSETQLVYLDGFIVFVVAHDVALLEGGGGLGIFDLQSKTASLVTSEQFLQLQSTSDGSKAILETYNHSLTEALAVGKSLALKSVLDTPVATWNLGSQGSLLVQLEGDSTYRVFNANSKTTNAPNLMQANQAQALQRLGDGEVIAVDW